MGDKLTVVNEIHHYQSPLSKLKVLIENSTSRQEQIPGLEDGILCGEMVSALGVASEMLTSLPTDEEIEDNVQFDTPTLGYNLSFGNGKYRALFDNTYAPGFFLVEQN